jgi:hypothetical protein
MSASAVFAIFTAAASIIAAVITVAASDRCPHPVNLFRTWTYYPKELHP